MNEEQDILRSAAQEFIKRNIEPIALQIERAGIQKNLVLELAAQGFLGAAPSEKLGGSGVSLTGYLAILEEFARVSPSLAVYLMITNSIVPSLLGEKNIRILGEVFSGNKIISVYINPALEGVPEPDMAKLSGTSLLGDLRNFILPGCDLFITPESSSKSLYLVHSSPEVKSGRRSLSVRGLGVKDVHFNFNSSSFENLGKSISDLAETLDSLDAEVAAILLGIARGAIEKVTNYVQVRTTFGQKLKDFGPVAYKIADLRTELEVAENYIGNLESENLDPLKIKLKAVSLAKEAAKYSLQFHGGYG